MNKTDAYEYRVRWSEEDEAFVARVTEFASLATHGETAEDALTEMKTLLADIIDDLESSGEPVPEPLGSREYSGRFNVRLPRDVHRSLVMEAARQGVSLNHLVTSKLAR